MNDTRLTSLLLSGAVQRRGMGNAMSPLVDFSKWRVRPAIGELSRSYNFSGLQASGTTATLTLDCRLKRSFGDHFIHSFLTLHLRPFRLLHETSLVMGLVTADQSEGGVVKVHACPIEGKRDTTLLAVESSQDVRKCLSAISSGKEMYFTLGSQTRPYVKLMLPNDGEFHRLYNDTYKRMARVSDASKDGLYFKRFLRGVDALVEKTKQRFFGTAFKDGRRLLTKTTSDTFNRLMAATFGLTQGYSLSHKISAVVERLKAQNRKRAAALAQGASRDGFYLTRSFGSVDALRGAVKSRQRSFRMIFKDRSQLLTKITSDAFARLKATAFTLTRGYSFPHNIYAIAERLKARMRAPVVARTQDTSDKSFLHDFDALLDAATAKQRSFKIHRDWVVFGASLLVGIVIIVAVFGSSNIQSTSNSRLVSNSKTSPAGPDLTTASVKIPAETVAYVSGPLDSATNEPPKFADKEPPKQAQPSAPAEVHPVKHAIGDVGTLKQNFVGCHDSWQDDGSLQLESKLSATECNVRLPAGTKVIVANIRKNNDICLRFPDSVLCYWVTGDVLKVSGPVPSTPTESHTVKPKAAMAHPAKAGPAKAHAAIRGHDDDQLNFLFNR
jgi:hypothetical protein